MGRTSPGKSLKNTREIDVQLNLLEPSHAVHNVWLRVVGSDMTRSVAWPRMVTTVWNTKDEENKLPKAWTATASCGASLLLA